MLKINDLADNLEEYGVGSCQRREVIGCKPPPASTPEGPQIGLSKKSSIIGK